MSTDKFRLLQAQSVLSYHRVCYKSITTEATREAGTYYLLFTLGLYKNMHCTILSFL